MATPVIMPRQGQSVETCIITMWHKTKGEKVSVGDILFSYETDKAAFDEEASIAGTLLNVFFDEGDEVPVLVNVAVIGNESEESESFRPGGSDQPASSNPEIVATTPEPAAAPEETNEDNPCRPKISPLAKRLSKEFGINPDQIKGSGPNGRIIKSDIEAAKASLTTATVSTKAQDPAQTFTQAPRVQQQATPFVVESNNDFKVEKISNMRKIIAAKMHESLQNSAQLTHHLSADARKILQYRKKIKQQIQAGNNVVDITINDLVCFAVIKALKKHPHMNAHFQGDTIKTFNHVHLGLAVDTPRGLMVPALQNAEELNLEGLASRLKNMARECKDGTIHPDLLASTAASFTISNLGAFGIEMFTPVLNIPQTGILGVNTITHRPADLGDGTIGFVPHIGLSLTYDHRAVDGAPASAFLREIKEQIENLS
jgi:pyruvate dehydrogenase E2 component (dihydrolipoamide acetyltransferase)